MAINLTPADESYRADFIVELCKQGVTESDSLKPTEGIIFDPKVNLPGKTQLHLAANEISNSILRENLFVIKQ